jgi:hypothetical protein
MRSRQRHGPLGPDRQRPLRMSDAIAMEGEVDHELARGGPVKRTCRTAHDDRTEDPDVNAFAHHAGERSAATSRRGPTSGSPQPDGVEDCVGAEGFEPSLGTV